MHGLSIYSCILSNSFKCVKKWAENVISPETRMGPLSLFNLLLPVTSGLIEVHEFQVGGVS